MDLNAKEVRDCKDPITVGLLPKHFDMMQKCLLFANALSLFDTDDIKGLEEVLNDSLRAHSDKYEVVCSCEPRNDQPGALQRVSWTPGTSGSAGWNQKTGVVVSCNPGPTSLEDL